MFNFNIAELGLNLKLQHENVTVPFKFPIILLIWSFRPLYNCSTKNGRKLETYVRHVQSH